MHGSLSSRARAPARQPSSERRNGAYCGRSSHVSTGVRVPCSGRRCLPALQWQALAAGDRRRPSPGVPCNGPELLRDGGEMSRPASEKPAQRGRSAGFYEWLTEFRAAVFDAAPGQLSTAKAVGVMIATYADPKTGANAYPGHDLISSHLSLSAKTVSRSVTSLEKAGYLHRVRRGTQTAGGKGVATMYQLTLPASASPESVDSYVRSLGRKWGESLDTGV